MVLAISIVPRLETWRLTHNAVVKDGIKRRIASQLSVLSVSIITQTSIMTSLGTNFMQVLDWMGEVFFCKKTKMNV